MAFSIDDKGITIDTYDDIFNGKLASKYYEVYGNDITLDVNSPDGQIIGIYAKIHLDLQTALLHIYNSQDIDFAKTVELNRLAKLFGVFRRPPVKSSWKILVTCDQYTSIPSNFVIQDSLKQRWLTNTSYNLQTGENYITLFSEDYGSIKGFKDEILNPVTIIAGIVSFKSADNAVLGVDEESDIDLRRRIKNSTYINSQSTLGSMYSRLANLSNVRDVKVYENNTQYEKDTIPPNSLWIIVNGGEVNTIVETIVKNKAGGVGLKGSISGRYIESLTREDGSTYNIEHTANYDNPIIKDLFLNIEVKKTNIYGTIDSDTIKNNLSNYVFLIGENVINSKFYELGYIDQKDLIIESIKISNDGKDYVIDEIVVNMNELYKLDKDNIKIIER